jgi:3-oxoacyl-[acyl-carrier-protein] synthase-1
MTSAVAILNTGLVTSVGLTAPAACAAIRAGLTNPSDTRFRDSSGDWIKAHQVLLNEPYRGRTKLVKMAAAAISQCLGDIPRSALPHIPLLLCVAERDRPGRLDDIEDDLSAEIQSELVSDFSKHSRIYPYGRVSGAAALGHARQLIAEGGQRLVLIAATDSLLTWPTLGAYERARRLLTRDNSNGFMPGEGASALLVGPAGTDPQLLCTGLGFATEPAPIDSSEPLRGDGLTRAIKDALTDASCEMHDLDFRISDVSGEHYYFKEAALALTRTLRVRKPTFDIWHPAESIGEVGAVAGLASIAVANAACRKRYADGLNVLCHAANDAGQRAATIVQFGIAS